MFIHLARLDILQGQSLQSGADRDVQDGQHQCLGDDENDQSLVGLGKDQEPFGQAQVVLLINNVIFLMIRLHTQISKKFPGPGGSPRDSQRGELRSKK